MSHRKVPSSCLRSVSRLALSDVAVALAAPVLAIALRDKNVFFRGDDAGLIYAAVGFAAGLAMLVYFRVGAQLSEYFAPHDVMQLVKVSLGSVALTAVLIFPVTRLEGIPRAIPLMHLGALFLGLCAVRALFRMRNSGAISRERRERPGLERILLVGTDRLAWFYIRALDSLPFVSHAIVGLLSSEEGKTGRTLSGYTILGTCMAARGAIDELSVHGVSISRIVVADAAAGPGSTTWSCLDQLCAERGLELDFLPERLKLPALMEFGAGRAGETVPATAIASEAALAPQGRYWTFKRALDIVASLLLLVLLVPAFLLVGVLVAISFGLPLVFWQERLGRHARPIHVHKFRSMKAPFDKNGRLLEASERETRIGRFLRASRLDELPQLLDILRGDMSFIGPRPLLPVDQPRDMRARLSVRPGLSGWAQVNGGKIISPEEKNALDLWYIANASLWLDLRIALLTVRSMLFGDRRNEAATRQAMPEGMA